MTTFITVIIVFIIYSMTVLYMYERSNKSDKKLIKWIYFITLWLFITTIYFFLHLKKT